VIVIMIVFDYSITRTGSFGILGESLSVAPEFIPGLVGGWIMMNRFNGFQARGDKM